VVFLCLKSEKGVRKKGSGLYLKKRGQVFTFASSLTLFDKKRGQVFTFASSLTLFDKVKDTHFIMHSVS
jgi:hypothetical protein